MSGPPTSRDEHAGARGGPRVRRGTPSLGGCGGPCRGPPRREMSPRERRGGQRGAAPERGEGGGGGEGGAGGGGGRPGGGGGGGGGRGAPPTSTDECRPGGARRAHGLRALTCAVRRVAGGGGRRVRVPARP